MVYRVLQDVKLGRHIISTTPTIMISKIKQYGNIVLSAVSGVAMVAVSAPVAFAASLDDVVNSATTSVQDTYGFGLDSVATWMWTNLGQPILGTGLGTLVTLRFYILGIVALGIIIYFCFRYFGFFKH